MRIQHNIPAMNAYRNYSANNSAIAKNLEKLSTGYRINRAGDDAAGLAISEKMRAQLSGLEQAQNNAKAGISLVQTGEGALTEVHSMLNRMYTLAEQSANGTYDDSVDRLQLQKEVESLKSEINRIADSTNYNGIKLLDGSLDGTTRLTNATARNLTGMSLVGVDTGDVDSIQYHQNGVDPSKTSFSVSLDGINFDTTSQTKGTLWLASKAANTNVVLKQEFDINGTDSAALAKSIYDSTYDPTTGNHTVTVNLAADGVAGTDAAKQIEYEVSLGEDGKTLNFTMTDKGFETAKAAYEADTDPANYFIGGFNFGIGAGQLTSDTKADAIKLEFSEQESATSNVHMGSVGKGEKRAEASYGFEAAGTTIKDGAGVKIGDQYYIWGGRDETVNGSYADNVHVIDIRDLVGLNGELDLDVPASAPANTDYYETSRTEALARLTEAAKGNEMFSVQLNAQDRIIVFTEKTTNPSDADLTNLAGLKAQLQTFTSFDKAGATSGKALTLQIGDTADSFNQMSVNVRDCHVKALGLDGVDISTQEGAAKALDAIKAAVNYVSDVRGTMGALQNRLDHTINNLGVMQENIQDAESVIRDTDVAKEMMAYTKNNILMQASQAMLAQANQLPQGVLQLLG